MQGYPGSDRAPGRKEMAALVDLDRREFIKRALGRANLDALVCALPANVLMLSGYWPVIGTALAIATWEGRIGLIVPADEEELAADAGADVLRAFHPGSLDAMRTAAEAARDPLREAAELLGVAQGRIGCEGEAAFEPAAYAAMHLYGAGMLSLLAEALPDASPLSAGEWLARLRAVKTPHEIEHIRTACHIAGNAFREGALLLYAGLHETEAAASFRAPLSTRGTGFQGSGENCPSILQIVCAFDFHTQVDTRPIIEQHSSNEITRPTGKL
jgi:Xaa-Pro aminopeptidase